VQQVDFSPKYNAGNSTTTQFRIYKESDVNKRETDAPTPHAYTANGMMDKAPELSSSGVTLPGETGGAVAVGPAVIVKKDGG
jgi:hypothetical protein